MFQSPYSPKLALLTLLIVNGALLGTGAARAQAPAAAPAPPPPTGFAFVSLRPALANVQNTIANLGVARWKAPAETRAAVQKDIVSMQRDLNATLPGLVAQAEANPAELSPAFAVFRNLDALYDVLLRVTETAASGSGSDAGSLEDARAGLEDARAKLGAWLLQSIGAQDAQVARLQAAVASSRPAAAPPAAPAKIVVDDGPEAPKPHKKPAPTPAPQ